MENSITLRPYQRQSVDALFKYFEDGNKGNPLVALPTGSGKSIVQAAFVSEAIASYPSERFMLISHVKELIEQNAAKLPESLDVGVYSAGLGRRELGHQITIAGIQSVHRRAHEMGHIGIVIIDESHTVTKTGNTMYQRFLRDLRKFCPAVKVIGMSATPFRLDSGPLIKGDNRIFTDIVCNVTIKQLINDGWLSPLVSARVDRKVSAKGIAKRGGEYATGDLEKCMMEEGNTEAALDEVERLCHDRKGWLVFCVGVDHAAQVCDAIKARGYAAEIIVGDTPKKERAERIAAFKAGKLRALVSVGVLTTGFDAPNADALICLRPTLSPVLWVQMVGRISRIAEGKADGMVVDFTENTQTHGPVDLIDIDGDGNIKTSPFRICPECGELNDPRLKACEKCGASFAKDCPKCMARVDRDARTCPECGHWFSRPREAKHASRASTGEIISTDLPQAHNVEDWEPRTHSKAGKPDSMKVTYWSGIQSFSEWICPAHGGYAGSKASAWWTRRGGAHPGPETAEQAILRFGELTMPETITVKRDGKYWAVMS